MKHGIVKHAQHKPLNHVSSLTNVHSHSKLVTSQIHVIWKHATIVPGNSPGWETLKAREFLEEITTFLMLEIGLLIVQMQMMKHKRKWKTKLIL